MHYYKWHVPTNWSAWDTVGVVVAVIMAYCVWRLWRGMRLDSFERSIRTLRQQPQVSVAFPRQANRKLAARDAKSKSKGFLQISLLPLMLISTGIAILLAQTQRPDELSRAVTWGLFVTVGTWYAIAGWPARRGAGQLRNLALAGVWSATAISALLWGFYMAVDLFRGDGQFTRLTASVPVLLWWAALGGVTGAILGSFRAGRIYSTSRTAESSEQPWQPEDVSLAVEPHKRSKRWPAIMMACGASLLFHASAAPQLYREIHVHYWYWGNYPLHNHWTNNTSLTLTLAPVTAQASLQDTLLIAPVTTTNWNTYRSTTRSTVTATSSVVRAIQTPDNNPVVRQVYVLSRPIQTGQRITQDVLRVETRELDQIPKDALSDTQPLVGAYARTDLPAGLIVEAGSVYFPRNQAQTDPTVGLGPEGDPVDDLAILLGPIAVMQVNGEDVLPITVTEQNFELSDGTVAEDLSQQALPNPIPVGQPLPSEPQLGQTGPNSSTPDVQVQIQAKSPQTLPQSETAPNDPVSRAGNVTTFSIASGTAPAMPPINPVPFNGPAPDPAGAPLIVSPAGAIAPNPSPSMLNSYLPTTELPEAAQGGFAGAGIAGAVNQPLSLNEPFTNETTTTPQPTPSVPPSGSIPSQFQPPSTGKTSELLPTRPSIFVLTSGPFYEGVILNEDDKTITLQTSDGKKIVLQRDDIDSIKRTAEPSPPNGSGAPKAITTTY